MRLFAREAEWIFRRVPRCRSAGFGMVKLNHSIVRDFLSLITNRGLDSLISIVIVPYLLSKIGNIEYGKIIVAQSIACIGVAIINYGTDLLMLQKVPEYVRFRKGAGISILVSRIFWLRSVLFILFGVVVFLILTVFVEDAAIRLYTEVFLILCLAEVFSVSHVLVAFHDVKILPRISVVRFLFLLLFTFLLVKGSSDSIRYVCLLVISYFLSNLYILGYVFRKYHLHCYPTNSFVAIQNVFVQSSPFFTSRLNLLLSDKLYNLLSATFISLSTAALLDISFKILSVLVIPVQILNSIILGHVSVRSSPSQMRRIFGGVFVFSVSLFLVLVLLQKYVLLYYSFPLTTEICLALSIILFSSVFANLSIFIGENVMVSYSLGSSLVKSSIYASLFVFPLLIGVLNMKQSIIVIALFFLLHKICEFALRLFYSWKYL